jgi:succinate dehydrogenase/fumarate reductase flavoprotein subunit
LKSSRVSAIITAMTRPPGDLLVIGGGMAGLSAAAWAVRHGGSAVLIEKGDLGGSAARAGFVWTAPTFEALREAIPDGDAALARELVDGFGPAVDWIRSLGVEVQPAVTVLRFGRGHQISMPNYLHACEVTIRDDPESELLLGAETEQLIVENGAVHGAQVRLASGEVRELRAACTLLTTGGFGGDPDLRAQLIHPQARDLPLRANRFSRGDGLRLACDVGAGFGPENAGFYGHLMAAGVRLREEDDYPALSLFQSEHAVLFNLNARRFVDETVGDHLTTLALLEQPEARGLLISDQRAHDLLSIPYVEGVLPTDFFDNVFRRGARAALAQDVDELAYLPEEWGYDGAAIRQALLDFNRACVDGAVEPPRRYDPAPIDQPPFRVVEAVPAITFTFGGLLIDTSARVLGEDGAPIPGLLAAGADAGGGYVRAYAGGLAWALVFGLRAAQTALARREVAA